MDKDSELFDIIRNYVEETLYVRYDYNRSGYKISNLYNNEDEHNSSVALYAELIRVFALKSDDAISLKLFSFCDKWYKNKIVRLDLLNDIIINGYLKNCVITLGARSWIITYNDMVFQSPDMFVKHIMNIEEAWFTNNKRLESILDIKLLDLIINESAKIMGS